VSGEASEAQPGPSRTSDVENETGSKSIGRDDVAEHTADKGHPRSDGEASYTIPYYHSYFRPVEYFTLNEKIITPLL